MAWISISDKVNSLLTTPREWHICRTEKSHGEGGDMEKVLPTFYEIWIGSHDLNAIRVIQESGRADHIRQVVEHTGTYPPRPDQLQDQCCVCRQHNKMCLKWPQFPTMMICHACTRRPLFKVYNRTQVGKVYGLTRVTVDLLVKHHFIHHTRHDYGIHKHSRYIFMKWELDMLFKSYPIMYTATTSRRFQSILDLSASYPAVPVPMPSTGCRSTAL